MHQKRKAHRVEYMFLIVNVTDLFQSHQFVLGQHFCSIIVLSILLSD